VIGNEKSQPKTPQQQEAQENIWKKTWDEFDVPPYREDDDEEKRTQQQ